MSEYKLTSELLKLSESQKWDEAKLEWDIADIDNAEEPETCLCGHYPILEICTIFNGKTKKDARVGNSCVKKFNNKSDKIFKAINIIKKDIKKSVNAETLEFVSKNNWINSWEYLFYIDIFRKRNSNLSSKQIKTKESINQKIIYRSTKK